MKCLTLLVELRFFFHTHKILLQLHSTPLHIYSYESKASLDSKEAILQSNEGGSEISQLGFQSSGKNFLVRCVNNPTSQGLWDITYKVETSGTCCGMNALLWVWHGHCNHELTPASVTRTGPAQDQLCSSWMGEDFISPSPSLLHCWLLTGSTR